MSDFTAPKEDVETSNSFTAPASDIEGGEKKKQSGEPSSPYSPSSSNNALNSVSESSSKTDAPLVLTSARPYVSESDKIKDTWNFNANTALQETTRKLLAQNDNPKVKDAIDNHLIDKGYSPEQVKKFTGDISNAKKALDAVMPVLNGVGSTSAPPLSITEQRQNIIDGVPNEKPEGIATPELNYAPQNIKKEVLTAQAIAKRNSIPQNAYIAGNSFTTLGKPDEAIEMYNTALANLVPSQEDRGNRIMTESGVPNNQTPNATDEMVQQTTIQAGHNPANIYNGLGQAYAQKGDDKRALEYYQQALSYMGWSPDALQTTGSKENVSEMQGEESPESIALKGIASLQYKNGDVKGSQQSIQHANNELAKNQQQYGLAHNIEEIKKGDIAQRKQSEDIEGVAGGLEDFMQGKGELGFLNPIGQMVSGVQQGGLKTAQGTIDVWKAKNMGDIAGGYADILGGVGEAAFAGIPEAQKFNTFIQAGKEYAKLSMNPKDAENFNKLLDTPFNAVSTLGSALGWNQDPNSNSKKYQQLADVLLSFPILGEGEKLIKGEKTSIQKVAENFTKEKEDGEQPNINDYQNLSSQLQGITVNDLAGRASKLGYSDLSKALASGGSQTKDLTVGDLAQHQIFSETKQKVDDLGSQINGAGWNALTPEAQNKIIQKFQQAQNTLSDIHKDDGLKSITDLQNVHKKAELEDKIEQNEKSLQEVTSPSAKEAIQEVIDELKVEHSSLQPAEATPTGAEIPQVENPEAKTTVPLNTAETEGVQGNENGALASARPASEVGSGGAEPKKQNFTQFAKENGYPDDYDTSFQAQLLGGRGLEGQRQSNRSIKEQDDAFQKMQNKKAEGKKAYEQAILDGKVIDPDGKLTREGILKRDYDFDKKELESKIANAESGIKNIEGLGKMAHLDNGKLKKGYQRAVDDYNETISKHKATLDKLKTEYDKAVEQSTTQEVKDKVVGSGVGGDVGYLDVNDITKIENGKSIFSSIYKNRKEGDVFRGVESGNLIPSNVFFVSENPLAAKDYTRAENTSGKFARVNDRYGKDAKFQRYSISKDAKILDAKTIEGVNELRKILGLKATDKFQGGWDKVYHLLDGISKEDTQKIKDAGYDAVRLYESDRDTGMSSIDGDSIAIVNKDVLKQNPLKAAEQSLPTQEVKGKGEVVAPESQTPRNISDDGLLSIFADEKGSIDYNKIVEATNKKSSLLLGQDPIDIARRLKGLGIDVTDAPVDLTSARAAPKTTDVDSGINVGVSHEALNKLAKQLGLPEIKRGQVLTPEQYADIGRKMLKDGIDPTTILDANIDHHEKIAISRAYYEELVKKADAIKDKTSDEYRELAKEIDNYETNVIKKLGTEWAESGRALQGQRNLATDSFFEAERTLKQNLGVDELSKDQIEKLQKQTEEIQAQKQRIADLEQKLKDAVNKEFGDDSFVDTSYKKSNETNRQKRIQKVDKFFDDAISKLSNKGVAYSTIIPPNVIKLALKGMKEAYHAGEEISKIVEDAIKYISDKIKTDWDKEKFRDEYTDALNDIHKKHLTPEEKLLQRKERELQNLKDGVEKKKSGKTEYNLSDEEKAKLDDLNNEIKNIKLAKVKIELQKQFASKKDSKFTPQEAKSLYNYGKEVYLNNGVGWDDMVKYVSSDMGLTPDQVRNAIISPKTKPISMERWKEMAELRKNRNATQQYIDDQSQSFLLRQAKKTSGDIRENVTFGHGHIFLGTHAGLTLFSNPVLWAKAYAKGIDLAYRMKPEEVEQFQHDFKNRPLWAAFNKAGLQNDLTKMGNDMELASQSHFLDLARGLHKQDNAIGSTAGKVLVGGIEAGRKGFMAIKLLRQSLAEQAYDNLTDAKKADPKSLEAIAQLMNNATGATNVKLHGGINDVVKEVLFAGGMEVSRWEKILKNPAKSMAILSKMGVKEIGRAMGKEINELPPHEKVFATLWAKRVMTQVLAYGGVVAISKMLFPDKDKTRLQTIKDSLGTSSMFKINLPHGEVLDLTSGMASSISLLGKLYKAIPKGETWDALGDYARPKLAPTYQTGAEVFTGHDEMGNTVPFRNIATAHWYNHYLTTGEYAESKSPIPIAEGLSSYNESNSVATGIVNGVISGSSGFKSYNKEKDIQENRKRIEDKLKKDLKNAKGDKGLIRKANIDHNTALKYNK